MASRRGSGAPSQCHDGQEDKDIETIEKSAHGQLAAARRGGCTRGRGVFAIAGTIAILLLLEAGHSVAPKTIRAPTSHARLAKQWIDIKRCAGVGAPTEIYGLAQEDLALMRQFFCGMRGGTFVEMGAFDGVKASNSKFFEDSMGWSGVLLEAFPPTFEKLKKNRPGPNSLKMLGAICPGESIAMRGHPFGASVLESISEDPLMKKAEDEEHVVPCRTLGKMFTEAGLSHVTFFSLDVEGAELLVLQQMDWDVPVCVWLVETFLLGQDTKVKVRDLLAANGYTQSSWQPPDYVNEVFEHPDLKGCLARTGRVRVLGA